MKGLKILALVAVAAVLLISADVVFAALIPTAESARKNARADNSPVIGKVDGDDGFNLTVDAPGLERIVFIHYKKGHAKPDWAGGGKKPQEPKCYDFLGRGVKWTTLPVDYVIDPDNFDGLDKVSVSGAIVAAAEEWDFHTGANLFGSYSVDYNASWDIDKPDGRNELVFGDYSDRDVIAVTVVWGYFSGPPGTRKIIEFDILFDKDYSPWGDASGNSDIMDLQNIATHEFGHGVGLGDVYETSCLEVTMYGYSNYGEIDKRTLETPDITGLQSLYGE